MKNVTLERMQKQNPFLKYISFSGFKSQVIVEAICFLFIFLFMYAAVSKLIDYQKFKVQVGQSPLLTAFSNWVIWIIPGIEILISLSLAIQKWKLLGLYASFSLMVMFTAYIIAITSFSSFVPCSCGGILQNMTWTQHLVFNIAFVLLALVGILIRSKQHV
jgi:hypothetical protein